MARTTMATLIQELRVLGDAGENAYTVGNVSYWSDNQLQTYLDLHRREIRYQDMAAQETRSGGSITYLEYWTGLSSWEGSPTILDGDYNTVGTADYTFDATRGVVTFVANTAGAVRMITGTVFNVNAAAAEVWNRKAAHYGIAYDVSTDNHSLKRSQIVTQCERMARRFEILPPTWEQGQGSAGSGSVYAERGDMG